MFTKISDTIYTIRKTLKTKVWKINVFHTMDFPNSMGWNLPESLDLPDSVYKYL